MINPAQGIPNRSEARMCPWKIPGGLKNFIQLPEEQRIKINGPNGPQVVPSSNVSLFFLLTKLFSSVPGLIAKITEALFPEDKRIKEYKELGFWGKIGKWFADHANEIIAVYFGAAGLYAPIVPFVFRTLLAALGVFYLTYIRKLDKGRLNLKKKRVKLEEKLKKLEKLSSTEARELQKKKLKKEIQRLRKKEKFYSGRHNLGEDIALLSAFTATTFSIVANKGLKVSKFKYDDYKKLQDQLPKIRKESVEELLKTEQNIEKSLEEKLQNEDNFKDLDPHDGVQKCVDLVYANAGERIASKVRELIPTKLKEKISYKESTKEEKKQEKFSFHKIEELEGEISKLEIEGAKKEELLKIHKELFQEAKKRGELLSRILDRKISAIKKNLKFLPTLSTGNSKEIFQGANSLSQLSHKTLRGIERGSNYNLLEKLVRNGKVELRTMFQLLKPSQLVEEIKWLKEGRLKELKEKFKEENKEKKGCFFHLRMIAYVLNESSISLYLFLLTALMRLFTVGVELLTAQKEGSSQFADQEYLTEEEKNNRSFLRKASDELHSLSQTLNGVSSAFTIDGNSLGITLSAFSSLVTVLDGGLNYAPAGVRNNLFINSARGVAIPVAGVASGLAANSESISELLEASLTLSK